MCTPPHDITEAPATLGIAQRATLVTIQKSTNRTGYFHDVTRSEENCRTANWPIENHLAPNCQQEQRTVAGSAHRAFQTCIEQPLKSTFKLKMTSQRVLEPKPHSFKGKKANIKLTR